MVNINEIKTGVKSSFDFYKTKIKESLKGQVPDDYRYFPILEDELDLRFDNLTIEYASIFDNSVTDYVYNGLQNKLIISKKYFKREDINFDNLFMDIVVNIAYYNPETKFSGFGNENFEALNKGFREIIVRSLTNSCRSEEYFESDEYIYANLISRIFDLKILWNAFQDNDPDYFNEDMKKNRNIEFYEIFIKLNQIANRNYKVRNNKKELTSLDEIEYLLFKLKLLDEPSKEELDEFMANMAFTSEIFKDEKKYQRLNELNFDNEYKIYLESLISNQHIL